MVRQGWCETEQGVQPAPRGRVQPGMAVHAAQHSIVNSPKTVQGFFMITCRSVFSEWPKTTLLLPAWPRDARRLDTPG